MFWFIRIFGNKIKLFIIKNPTNDIFIISDNVKSIVLSRKNSKGNFLGGFIDWMVYLNHENVKEKAIHISLNGDGNTFPEEKLIFTNPFCILKLKLIMI